MSDQISRIAVKFFLEGIGVATGEFVTFLAPRTVQTLMRALPVGGRAAVWKEEVYFQTSLKMGPEKPKAKVEKGCVAYWPMGSAVCIFFGNTQPYSPVNVIGRITENLELFSQVKPGTNIRLVAT
ncbi:MAG: cyclophilin-like family protein [archaeon]